MRKDFTFLGLNISIGCAGYIAIWRNGLCLHFLCKRKHWIFGRERDYYDGPIYCYGLGPLFLITHIPDSDIGYRISEFIFKGIK